MPDPDKIILPGEEEFPPSPPLLLPEGFEHRNAVRRQGLLYPENGRRPFISRPCPLPGALLEEFSAGELNTAQGLVLAMTVVRVSDNPDTPLFDFGFGSSNLIQSTFDPGGDFSITHSSVGPSAIAGTTLAGFRLFPRDVPVRFAFGIRMSDRNRHMLYWVNGRLITTNNSGTFVWPMPTWAGTNVIRLSTGEGLELRGNVSIYLGDPAPRGGNR